MLLHESLRSGCIYLIGWYAWGRVLFLKTVLSFFCFPCESCYLLSHLQLTGSSNVPFSGSTVNALVCIEEVCLR